MDPEILEALRIALSSAFIGLVIATTLYGISCLQMYLYYRNYPKDPMLVKLTVSVLWCLDTMATFGVAHTLHTYLVSQLGNADVDFIIPWSYAVCDYALDTPNRLKYILNGLSFLVEQVQSETVDLVTLITQCFFAWQIWKVGKNAVIVGTVIFLSVSAWALDIVVVVNMFRDNSGLVLASPLILITGTTVQGLDALCDIIITASFIYYLQSFKTGIKPTEKIIDNLILYAVSRGILTVITQITFVCLDGALPGKLYWLPFQQAIGKLYVNSVLASLNSRKWTQKSTLVNFTETISIGTSPGSSGPGGRQTGSSGIGIGTGTLPISFSPNGRHPVKSMTESYGTEESTTFHVSSVGGA